MFRLQPIAPLELFRTLKLQLCLQGQLQAEAQMPVAGGDRVIRLQEPVASILPHRLQQSVPPAALLILFVDDQRLLDQVGEQIQHFPALNWRPRRVAHGALLLGVGADLLRRLPGSSRRRRRRGAAAGSLRLGEQVVAPVDGGPQRLLARQGGAAAAGQQAEACRPSRARSAPRTAPSPARRPARSPAGCRPAARRSAPPPARSASVSAKDGWRRAWPGRRTGAPPRYCRASRVQVERRGCAGRSGSEREGTR